MTQTGNKSIVIIDDDHDDLFLINEMANTVGFADPVVMFHEPVPAVEYILKSGTQVSLIIADVNMPRLNGFEVRKKLIEAGIPVADIPFVFLSTSMSPKEVEAASDLAVYTYYKKPDSGVELKNILLEIKEKNSL